MAAGRGSKALGRRRERGDDEEEDLLEGDSHSETSVASVTIDTILTNGDKTRKSQEPTFKPSADTEAMMNGLSITDAEQNAIDSQATDTKSRSKGNVEQSRMRREHEEYKKKRDADPAFIPNRGNFFMHDTRGQSNGGPVPTRGNTAMRGRGRGGPSEVISNGHGRAAEQVWKHDLHSAINEEPAQQDTSQIPHVEPVKTGPLSFSSSQMLGRIQLRVQMPGMAKPVVYSEVPAVKYVRLPDHRPPLRRDKPVRIFLPGIGPRYIFPSTERSFIFIPRQMRPNNRGHGLQQRHIGGYGYSSRRTSMYGGSMYSASVAHSRRSSITRDRENMFSPASYVSGYQPSQRPVVRLPHNGQYYMSSTPPMYSYSGQHTPIGQIHTYPLPQQPAFQGTPTTTVQHPRPQKAISVSGIESPAMLSMPPMDSQAFQGQLPSAMGHHSAHPSQGSIGYDFPQQQFAYPGPAASPLTRIPEQPQMFYPPYAGAQHGYYYPPMPMYGYPPMQQQYPVPPDAQPAASTEPAQATGMVAHESNGMVFYMSAGEAAAQPNTSEQYQPAEGFVPSFIAPSGPTADQGVYYYPPAVAANMNYYPPMQQT